MNQMVSDHVKELFVRIKVVWTRALDQWILEFSMPIEIMILKNSIILQFRTLKIDFLAYFFLEKH